LGSLERTIVLLLLTEKSEKEIAAQIERAYTLPRTTMWLASTASLGWIIAQGWCRCG